MRASFLGKFFAIGAIALGLGLAGCGSGTSSRSDDGYRPGMSEETTAQLFNVALSSDPGPPIMGMNTVTLVVTKVADGSLVSGAFVKLVPYMPAHGHGSNSQPTVTEIAPGHYQFNPVELQMVGLWEFNIQIDTLTDTDTVVFSFEVS